jgi:glycolate oxidase FAD binding subunit
VVSVAIDGVDALREAVRSSRRVLPAGGSTKPALSTAPSSEVTRLDLGGLCGIVEYDPAELTLTARAGTPVSELGAALAEHGQYLPFDPPLAAQGASIGGVVASATSGPGAFRYGTVRDFVIGVQVVDGTGELVRGGGRVVKNAAGFDLPKLMVGSAGRLGVLTQVSLKVFPRPRAVATVAFELADLPAALAALAALARGPVELDALDLDPPGRLLVRLGGEPDALEARVVRVATVVSAPAQRVDADVWAISPRPGTRLVRVALTPRSVPALDAALRGARARYSNGANVAWIAWPDDRDLAGLDAALLDLGLPGMPLTGAPAGPLLGARRGGAFLERLRGALDPDRRFLEI